MVKASAIPRSLPSNQAPRAVYGISEAMAEKLTAKKAALETKTSSVMPKSVVAKPTGLPGSSASVSATQQQSTPAKGPTDPTTKPTFRVRKLPQAALQNPGSSGVASLLSFVPNVFGEGAHPQFQPAPQPSTPVTKPAVQHGVNTVPPGLPAQQPSSWPQFPPPPAPNASMPPLAITSLGPRFRGRVSTCHPFRIPYWIPYWLLRRRVHPATVEWQTLHLTEFTLRGLLK